jgi:hypothetical protein
MEDSRDKEKKDRVLDLLWRNYDDQLASTRRVSDRLGIVLGATVGAIGLMLRTSEGPGLASGQALTWLVASMTFLVVAFVVLVIAWAPKRATQPSGTDVDKLWRSFVSVSDNESAANMMNDIGKATREERESTRYTGRLFATCCVMCAASIVSAIVCMVFASQADLNGTPARPAAVHASPH